MQVSHVDKFWDTEEVESSFHEWFQMQAPDL